jgi:small subunit ribosomal protein S8e
MIIQKRPDRKHTGGKYKSKVTKRIHAKGGEAHLTSVAERTLKSKRTMGNNRKYGLLSHDKINVFDPKSKKVSVAEIKSVADNPANRHFVRRNIMSKGTIVETSKGKVRITSRPGQEGSINGVLITS